MSSNAQLTVTPTPNAQSMIDFLEWVSRNVVGFTDEESWRLYEFTAEDKTSLFAYLRQPGQEELLEAMTLLRYDHLPTSSLLALRLPSLAQCHFTTTLVATLTTQLRALAHHVPGNNFLLNIVAATATHDPPAATTIGPHRPDVCFYYAPSGRRPRPPTIVVEICNAAKAADMGALAQHYLRWGDGATRLVVAVDVESGTYAMWRYLRFLPNAVDGREYRRVVQTEGGVEWKEGEGEMALTVRDFMPTVMPELGVGRDGEEGLRGLMGAAVMVGWGEMRRLWGRARGVVVEESDEESEEGEGSEGMDLEEMETEEDGMDMSELWDSSDEDAEVEEAVREGEADE